MKKQFRAKIFFKYFIRYISITITFIILLIPIYNTMYSIIKSQTIQEDSKKVFESINSLDDRIENATIISSLIEKDTYFSKLAKINSNLIPNEYFYMLKAGESLRDMREKYDMSIQTYVIFKSNKLFISNIMTSENYEDIYKDNLIYLDTSGEQIRKDALSSNQGMTFLPAQRVKYINSQTLNGLICVMNASVAGFGPTDYTIVYTIDVNDILGSLEIDNNKNQFLQISDNKGNVLLNHNYSGKSLIFDDVQSNYSDYKINGEDYSLIHTKTDYGNLNIVRGIKTTVFDEKINSVLHIIQAYIVIAFLFSIIYSFLLTYKQFVGVSKVLNVVYEKSNLSIEKNEYSYIRSAFLEISDENEQYEKDMVLMKNSIRSSIIDKLFLNGIYVEHEKQEFIQYFGLSIEYFCVVNINLIRETEEMQSDSMFKQYEKIFYYIQKKLENWSSNVLSTSLGGAEMVCLIPLEQDNVPNTQEICSFMKNIVKEIMCIFNYPIKIGISNIGVGISNVHTAYLQARHAMRQINNQPEFPVNVISLQDAQINNLEGFNLEQQLVKLIMTGEKENVIELFQRLNRHIKKSTFNCEQDIMQLFFAIRNPIFNAKNALQNHADDIQLPDYNENYSIDKLLQLLENTSLDLCDYSFQKKRSNNVTLKSSLLKYLNQEYTNINLCAALVADKFSISEKYVFHFIKEQTGVTFSKYVEDIRMQKAKELLQATDLSAVEIAGKVGFSSINTFYKAFNRTFGVAPIAWRESIK